jgi:putative nucleotidyltransferase with HDIG domain
MSVNTNIKHGIASLDSLPAMPVIAQKLLALHLDTDEGKAQLLALIAQDPQISAKIIGLANSPVFGTSRRIKTVSEAAILLGLTRVESIAVGIATISVLTKLPEGKFKAHDLWLHSMAIAMAMQVITKRMPARIRPLDSQVFLAGLLHDIGYMALCYLDINASELLQTRLQEHLDRSCLEIERELLGTTHEEIGALLGRHWNLPDKIITVIANHHTYEIRDERNRTLANLVCFAEKILAEFWMKENIPQEITEPEWLSWGIPADQANDIFEEIALITEQVKQLANTA